MSGSVFWYLVSVLVSDVRISVLVSGVNVSVGVWCQGRRTRSG